MPSFSAPSRPSRLVTRSARLLAVGGLVVLPVTLGSIASAGAAEPDTVAAATADPAVLGTVTADGAFTPADDVSKLAAASDSADTAASAAAYSAAAVKVSVAGPSTMTADATYRVTVTGSSKVCGIIQQSVRRQDMKKPYTLPITLQDLSAGRTRLKVYAVGCSTTDRYPVYGIGYKTIKQPVHVRATNRWIAPAAETKSDRKLLLKITTATSGVSARLTKGSKTVKNLGTRSAKKTTFSWSPGKTAPGPYTLAVTSGGHTVKLPVTITDGWAPLNPPFARCRTITWSYNATNEPARASGMGKDIATGFKRIHQASGITFKRVKKNGTIVLTWSGKKRFPEGETDADGLGGSTGNGTVATKGTVWFNTASTWVGQAGYGRHNGVPARGALILHEVSHSLGLGHVTLKDALMHPVASVGSPTTLTSYEKAGLTALYHAKSC